MKASIISPERVLFEGEVSSIVAPAFDGEVGILSRHAPMVTLLGEGSLEIGGRTFKVAGGFLQVVDNQVRIVTERASEG